MNPKVNSNINKIKENYAKYLRQSFKDMYRKKTQERTEKEKEKQQERERFARLMERQQKYAESSDQKTPERGM